MLKVIKKSWTLSRINYRPQKLRLEVKNFLDTKLPVSSWVDRLVMVTAELIANSCEHRFDSDAIELELAVTCYRDHIRVQIILDDPSNVLIMQRYKNLLAAVAKKNHRPALLGTHGRGLQIILHWTDSMQFSKKRSGGLKIKAVKLIKVG